MLAPSDRFSSTHLDVIHCVFFGDIFACQPDIHLLRQILDTRQVSYFLLILKAWVVPSSTSKPSFSKSANNKVLITLPNNHGLPTNFPLMLLQSCFLPVSYLWIFHRCSALHLWSSCSGLSADILCGYYRAGLFYPTAVEIQQLLHPSYLDAPVTSLFTSSMGLKVFCPFGLLVALFNSKHTIVVGITIVSPQCKLPWYSHWQINPGQGAWLDVYYWNRAPGWCVSYTKQGLPSWLQLHTKSMQHWPWWWPLGNPPSSSECLAATATTVLLIYRPPRLKSAFILEVQDLLSTFWSISANIIILGDLNIHVDTPSSQQASEFLQVLECLNLNQDVCAPTHTKFNQWFHGPLLTNLSIISWISTPRTVSFSCSAPWYTCELWNFQTASWALEQRARKSSLHS